MNLIEKSIFVVLVAIFTSNFTKLNCGSLEARIRMCLDEKPRPKTPSKAAAIPLSRAEELNDAWHAIKFSIEENTESLRKETAMDEKEIERISSMSPKELEKYMESAEWKAREKSDLENLFITRTERNGNIAQFQVPHQGDMAVCGYHALINGKRLAEGVVHHNDPSILLGEPIDINDQEEFIRAYRIEENGDASSDWLQSNEIEYLYDPVELFAKPGYRSIAENYMRTIGQNPSEMLAREARCAGYDLQFSVVDTADDLFDVFDGRSQAEHIRRFFNERARAVQIFIMGTGSRRIEGEEVILARGHWFAIVAVKNGHDINYYVADSLNARDLNKEAVMGIKFIIEGEI